LKYYHGLIRPCIEILLSSFRSRVFISSEFYQAMDHINLYSGKELLEGLANGDEQSFQIIYRESIAELSRYARRRISNKEDCEEILQDIFESLWKRHESLPYLTEIKPYLYSMLKYKIIRYYSHKKVIHKFEQHYLFFEKAYDSLPEEERTAEMIQQRLIECLNDLPERVQMAMRLRILENLSLDNIAKRMDIKKSTVKRYTTKAFDHLRGFKETLYRVD